MLARIEPPTFSGPRKVDGEAWFAGYRGSARPEHALRWRWRMYARHGRLLVFAALSTIVVAATGAEPGDCAMFDALPAARPGDSQLLAVTRAGKRMVAVGERGFIVYSDDGGDHWRQARVPVSLTLTAVAFVDREYGWAVGHGGVVLHTVDGGVSWQVQFTGDEANRQWLEYVRARRGALEARYESLRAQGGAAGDERLADIEYELEEATFDVADAEQALATGPTDPFLDVWFADRRQGIAVGAYGMIYRTRDGGGHWLLDAPAIDNPRRYHYYALESDRRGRLYLSGEAGLLYRSADGGESWQRIEGVYDGSLFGLATTADTVLAFGLRGHIFRSTDGGDTWMALPGDDGASLYGGAQLPGGTIVLVGAGGAVAVSVDGGKTFSHRRQPGRATLSGVAADAEGRVHVTGLAGVERVEGLRVAP